MRLEPTFRSSTPLATSVSISLLATILACGDGTVTPPEERDDPTPTVIEISFDASALLVDQNEQAEAVVRDQFGAVMDVPVSWSAQPTSVLNASSTGVVSGVGPGEGSLVASAGGATASQAVQVLEPALVFSQRGADGREIFVADEAGAVVVNVTADSEEDVFPHWSSTAKKLVYNSADGSASDIFVMDLLGSGKTNLTPGSSEGVHPRWSRDGSQILFESPEGGLHVMAADGSTTNQITLDLPSVQDARWSPDDSQVVFVTCPAAGNCEIGVVGANGANQSVLTGDTPYPSFSPAWSPDGTRIAFVRQSDLYTMAPDGSGQALIPGVCGNTRGCYEPSWSPDGSRIAFHGTEDLGATHALYLVDPDGSNLVTLVDNYGGGGWSWSEDGTRIGYVCPSESSALWDVCVVRIDGSGQARVTATPASYESPMWVN